MSQKHIRRLMANPSAQQDRRDHGHLQPGVLGVDQEGAQAPRQPVRERRSCEPRGGAPDCRGWQCHLTRSCWPRQGTGKEDKIMKTKHQVERKELRQWLYPLSRECYVSSITPRDNTGMIGDGAVVLGASLAGLLSARVLSDAYAQVTVGSATSYRRPTRPARECRRGRHHPRPHRPPASRCWRSSSPGSTEELMAQGVRWWTRPDTRAST